MIFSEEKAAEIAGRYGISPVTVRVWRLRGKIPAKYANTDFDPVRTKADEAAPILTLIQEPAINTRALADGLDLPYQSIIDALMGRSSLSLKAATKIKARLTEIASMKVVTEDQIRRFLELPEMHIKPLINPYNDKIYQRIMAYLQSKRRFPEEDRGSIIDMILQFQKKIN